jgi:hypothetical protein
MVAGRHPETCIRSCGRNVLTCSHLFEAFCIEAVRLVRSSCVDISFEVFGHLAILGTRSVIPHFFILTRSIIVDTYSACVSGNN